MLEAWLSAGQPYAAFWDMTPREITTVLRGVHKRDQAEIERQRFVAHELANLVAYAFHDPKSMPKYAPISESDSKGKQAADYEMARGQLMLLATMHKKAG